MAVDRLSASGRDSPRAGRHQVGKVGGGKPVKYELSLSERQLREIINALTDTNQNYKHDTETQDFRGSLAETLERTLWQPYNEEIARNRIVVKVTAYRK